MLTPLPPNECTRARESVSSRLDGELSELEAVWLDGHLGGCPSCSAYASDLSALTVRLRSTPLEPAKIQLFVPRPREALVRLQSLAAAAVLALAVGTSFAIGHMVGSHGSSPRAAQTITTAAADLSSLRADSTEQHLLAMLARVPLRSPAGRVIAL